MGLPVLILGYSGSGKSASMRNFGADEIALVNVNGKALPFRTDVAKQASRSIHILDGKTTEVKL